MGVPLWGPRTAENDIIVIRGDGHIEEMFQDHATIGGLCAGICYSHHVLSTPPCSAGMRTPIRLRAAMTAAKISVAWATAHSAKRNV
jgi:hypothetical protein